MKRKIKAEIIAGSLNEHGQKLTTYVLTYPRFIHAELLTHRLFSRNAASSRAIPASKMIADIEADPFIPVAWQKAHSGMQGTEYFKDEEAEDHADTWLSSMSEAIHHAKLMVERGVTKQLVNRILEPYQWYTSICTFTEGENFFELRCPQYVVHKGDNPVIYKSWKDCAAEENMIDPNCSDVVKLKYNKGQGEIHISLLAEAMWDSMNEYNYKQLKAGEWHIPFGDKFDIRVLEMQRTLAYSLSMEEIKVKIATARCARVSYLNFEGKDDYEADIKLYDRLLEMGHMSPFEHCARAMSDDEYQKNIQGEVEATCQDYDLLINEMDKGWSGNFRGFVQRRQEL